MFEMNLSMVPFHLPYLHAYPKQANEHMLGFMSFYDHKMHVKKFPTF